MAGIGRNELSVCQRALTSRNRRFFEPTGSTFPSSSTLESL